MENNDDGYVFLTPKGRALAEKNISSVDWWEVEKIVQEGPKSSLIYTINRYSGDVKAKRIEH